MRTRLLLADDHAILLDGLRALLQGQDGLEVVAVAKNGREAVRLALELEPDLLIMDIGMPELNGIEATRQILASRPNAQVIILSIHGTSEHLQRALNAGAAGYLLKESAGTELLSAIQTVREGRRYLSRKMEEELFASRFRDAGPNYEALLSLREREVLQLVVEGHSSATIGKRLALSPKTVDTYRSRLMRKLGVDNLVGLVRFALEHDLASPD